MTNESVIIEESELEAVKDSALFYPCSGEDLLVPIEIFSPYVTDFWFVDLRYFTRPKKHYGFDARADKQSPLLSGDDRYELLSMLVFGNPEWPPDEKEIDPCILLETYLHRESGREIRIRRRRGYGYSAFRKEISRIGVFFYRGDSAGEGGSGNHWLSRDHIDEICDKLIDGGLIVSDGSDGAFFRVHEDIYKIQFNQRRKQYPSYDFASDSIASFTDHKGRLFSCVGYAGMRYGPSLIWRVNKIPS
jgi:hypothetical protein